MAKKQRGEHLDDGDQQFLNELSSRSNKGLISVGAGVAYSLKGGARAGGLTPFSKTALEANTDSGAKFQEQVGVERNVGRGKMKMYESTNEDGSKHKTTVLYEQDLVKRGPLRLQAEARGSVDQENGAIGLKAKAQQEVPVPGFLAPAGVKKAEVEAYAYARLNVLNGTESAALEARMIQRADQLQTAFEQRQAAFRQIEQKKQELREQAEEAAAREAWQKRILPPEPPLYAAAPPAAAGAARIDAGTPRPEELPADALVAANSG